MDHGSNKRINGEQMSHLEFMNQDGEWEQFPTDEQLAERERHTKFIDALQVRIVCHLCNEPVPKEKIVFYKIGSSLSWSCEKCHAHNEGKAELDG